VLAETRALREALRKEILAWEDGDAIHHSTVTELNRLMAKQPHARQAERKWEGALDGALFLTAAAGRPVGPTGPQRRDVAHQRGSNTRAQV